MVGRIGKRLSSECLSPWTCPRRAIPAVLRWLPSVGSLFLATAALADEGGASVWLPGQFASFAAVPGDPGFSFETLIYTRQAAASANVNFSRGDRLSAGLNLSEQYVYLTPTYTFETPVLHGQLAVGVTFSLGWNTTSVWARLAGADIGVLSAAASDYTAGISDLYPTVSLKWQRGSHNFMAYSMASAPVGSFDPNRWSGVGVGHWALDAGVAYTFLPANGFEFSLTGGLTYNFVNPTTRYQSGMDGHIDVGTSYSPSDAFYFGVVGYLFNQISDDSGAIVPQLGGFRSRVAGLGPQIGSTFTIGPVAVDLNLRGYKEFAAYNRPEGWNGWLTISFSAARRASRD